MANENKEPDWVRKLDEQLRQLPDREAPHTLAPRVMAAIQARARLPWWRRTWWNWPPAAQLLSLLLCSGLLGLLTYLAMRTGDVHVAGRVASQAVSWSAPFQGALSALGALGHAAVILSRQLSTLAWVAAGAACAVFYLACMGLGTVMVRLVLNK